MNSLRHAVLLPGVALVGLLCPTDAVPADVAYQDPEGRFSVAMPYTWHVERPADGTARFWSATPALDGMCSLALRIDRDVRDEAPAFTHALRSIDVNDTRAKDYIRIWFEASIDAVRVVTMNGVRFLRFQFSNTVVREVPAAGGLSGIGIFAIHDDRMEMLNCYIRPQHLNDAWPAFRLVLDSYRPLQR